MNPGMSWRRIRAIARKEAFQIRRDPRSLAMAFLLPVILLVLFGAALSLDVDQVPLVVLDRDGTRQSRDLTAEFTGSRYFSLKGEAPGERAMERALDRRQAILGLVIHPGFGADLLAGREAAVQVIADGSDSMTAQFALGYARAIVAGYGARASTAARKASAPLVRAETRAWYNPSLKSRVFTVSGLLALVMIIVGTILTSLTIAREWETGTMEQLLATPVRTEEILIGKFLPYFAIGTFDLVAGILLAVFVFGAPLRGSAVLLLVLSSLFLAGALGQGLLISSFSRNQTLANQLGIVTSFLPAFLLSGFFAPISNMPLPLRVVTALVPARYAMEVCRGIMLKGVGLSILWPQALILLGYTALMFFLARRAFKRKLG